MKNCFLRVLCLMLTVALLLPLAACGPEAPADYDGPALTRSLLSQVTFDDTLASVGDAASLYFTGLPEGAKAELYLGSGYYADEVALITLASENDAKAAKEAAENHLEQVKNQFANYIPEELGKIEKAVVWQGGKYLILCITDDDASAKLILDHASDPTYRVPGGSTDQTTVTDPTDGSTPSSEATQPSSGTEPTVPTTQPTVPTTQPTVPTDGTPPTVESQTGSYATLENGMIRVDNRAFETCGYNDGVAGQYAQLINKAGAALAGKTNVYSLAIPTAFGIMMPDDIRAIYPGYTDQGQSIESVFSKLTGDVTPVRCYDKLMSHRDEYLYFRTDHHWNGIGAYYAYEAFCQTKGVTPYTMEQREEVQFGGFYGTLYVNSGKDPALEPADTVYAYKPVSSTASMVFYDKNGNGTNWSIISNVTNWNAGSKYSTFAGGDNPLSVITNPEVTDGSVCVVVKESYGNALIPFLTDHYSTIYEIDYRYWTGDIAEFCEEKGADDLLFANNIMMISTGLLVGMLADNIK